MRVVPAIVDQWKLVKVETVFHDPQVYDYSESNIIYEFKKDGNLEVSSDISVYKGRPPGEYIYSYDSDILTIGGLDYKYTSSDKELIIDISFVDGPIFYLMKI